MSGTFPNVVHETNLPNLIQKSGKNNILAETFQDWWSYHHIMYSSLIVLFLSVEQALSGSVRKKEKLFTTSTGIIQIKIRENYLKHYVKRWMSFGEGLKWTTETLHTSCCEGQDRILMWNCSLEKNETVLNSLWFFQSTQIAYVSGSGKFDVRDLYKGRLEQIGTMGILLKNVSSVDTGNYSLYLNVGPEPPENMQTIFLKVFESQKYQCKPSITKYSENVLFCSAYSCGGIQLSTEWRISEKYDFVSNESYLKINSSWNDEHVSCCLHIQCQNGNLLDVCASTNIFFVEDKYAPDSKSTDNSMNFTAAVVVLAMTNFLSIVICFRCRNKIHRLCAKRCKDTDKVLEPNNEPETRSMIE
ncbi:hypothetical protein ACJMK2_025775, partial [Sinanodonta woodiana]